MGDDLAIFVKLKRNRGPGTNGRGSVNVVLKLLLSCAVLLLLFEGMVTAFHLLNLPSNIAVLEGASLLLLTAGAGWFALRALWRRRT
jgi:hypothetical protein